jgi:hypothetical protein
MINDVSLTGHRPIYSVEDIEFNGYGKILENDTSEAVNYLDNFAALPSEGNCYKANDINFSKLKIMVELFNNNFAQMPIQSGYCLGFGRKMNGMEWHKSPEIIIAGTDMVLLLGHIEDVINDTYDSKKCIGFYLKKGDIVEINPYILHLAPLSVGEYFKAGIILPLGTNEALDQGIKGILRAKNKWLIVHAENIVGVKNGGKIGVIGENIAIV